MTPVFLLEELQKFISSKTSDIILPVRTRTGSSEEKERAAAVYKMGLPEADDVQQKVPYILLKFLTGTDDKKAGEPEEDSCKVRIIFAVYSEDGQDGPLALLNLILRVRSELKKAGTIGGGQFALELPLEYIVYQDTTPPYYMGEMVTNWSMPVTQRDVAEICTIYRQEEDKMAKATTASTTAAEKDAEKVQAVENTTTEEKATETANKQEGTVKLIYIGPNLPKAMLQCNKIFEGTKEEIKKELSFILEKFPLVEKMLVPTTELAEKKDKVKTTGNVYNKYYSDLKAAALAYAEQEV